MKRSKINLLGQAVAFALLAAVIFSPALLKYLASVPVVITMDPGGVVNEYIELYQGYRKNGRKVIIDGPCLSACTLTLGLIDPSKLCATSHAILGFHAAWYWNGREPVFSKDGTGLAWAIYPSKVRDILTEKYKWAGGPQVDMIFISGDELRGFLSSCGIA